MDAGLDSGVDAAAPWAVDYAAGTFTRASEASFLVRAPDSVGGFVAWAAADALRLEDRGDGAGPLLLIEGARTNLLLRSRDVGASPWTLPGFGSLVATDDAAPGPDGLMTALLLSGADGFSPGQQTPLSLAVHSVSAWGRAVTSSSTWTASYAYTDQPSIPAWYVTNQSTTWTRRTDTVTPATSGNYYPMDLTLGAGPLDLVLDLHQVEVGPFPSSAMRSDAAPAIRQPDVLVFESAQVPGALFVGRGRIGQVSPVFPSSAVSVGDVFWLLGIGPNGGVRIRHDGTGVVLEVVEGGIVRAQSAALTFSANQLLGVVEWSPADGLISVGGVAGPTGTPWVWVVDRVRVGGIPGGGGEAFARIGQLSGG